MDLRGQTETHLRSMCDGRPSVIGRRMKYAQSGRAGVKQGGTAGFSCPGKVICGAVFLSHKKGDVGYVRTKNSLQNLS